MTVGTASTREFARRLCRRESSVEEESTRRVVDWQFAPKWDLYAGLMYTKVNGGLANGFLQRDNLDPTVGLRFRF